MIFVYWQWWNVFWFDLQPTLYLWHLKLLSILLYKSNVWENCCSRVITGKAFNQLDWRILWSPIPRDEMTGSQWFFTNRQTARKVKKNSTKFFIGCGQACSRLHTIGVGAQRLQKSSSYAGNSIEWKIKWQEKRFHAFLIHNLSPQVLLLNQIAVFIN